LFDYLFGLFLRKPHLSVPAIECPVVDMEIDRDPVESLEEKLQNFKEPVIGL